MDVLDFHVINENFMEKKRVFFFLAGAFGFLVLMQQLFYFSSQTRLERELVNSLHTPWFFVLTLIIWSLQSVFIQKTNLLKNISFTQAMLICVVLSLGLAFATEAVQLLNSRQASFLDVLRDMLGAGSALCLISLCYHWQKRCLLTFSVFSIGLTGLFLSGFISVGQAWVELNERNEIAPQLLSFDVEGGYSGARIITRSEINVVEASNWLAFSGESVAKVTLGAGRWPGIILNEPYPDWGSYQRLVMSLYLDGEETLPLTVRVETFTDRGMSSTIDLLIMPGENNIDLPILNLVPELGSGAANIKNLLIFSDNTHLGSVFYIGDIRLE